MDSKNNTFPETQASPLTNQKLEKRIPDGSRSITSQGIESFPTTTQQNASTKAHLDIVTAILRKAISLADKDLEDLKETHSGSLGEDQSQSRH